MCSSSESETNSDETHERRIDVEPNRIVEPGNNLLPGTIEG